MTLLTRVSSDMPDPTRITNRVKDYKWLVTEDLVKHKAYKLATKFISNFLSAFIVSQLLNSETACL
jgi:hypothetical protein